MKLPKEETLELRSKWHGTPKIYKLELADFEIEMIQKSLTSRIEKLHAYLRDYEAENTTILLEKLDLLLEKPTDPVYSRTEQIISGGVGQKTCVNVSYYDSTPSEADLKRQSLFLRCNSWEQEQDVVSDRAALQRWLFWP